MSENIAQLSKRLGLESNLFEAIIKSSGDPIALKKIALDYKIGETSVFGAATAYDFITGSNADKKAYVCNGSSCLCAGTQQSVLSALQKRFNEDEIGHVCCLGRCHENASFQINGENFSGKDIEDLDHILSDSPTRKDNYSVQTLVDQPILTREIANLKDYYQTFVEQTTQFSKEKILQKIIDSKLRGRGGAGFPAGIKWQSCAEQVSNEKYIVCNADEGDPGAFTDRYLMEQRPHEVLFGMLVAGYLVGAAWGILYIRDEYPESVRRMQSAIQEFNALNIVEKINADSSAQSSFEFNFKIIRGAGAYICGEETALLRSIEGQRPMVSTRPPFPTVKGLFGQPTVVNNVETFAAIHFIVNDRDNQFATLGNGHSTGTKLLSLDGCFNRPGIIEVAMGERLSTVIKQAGGFKIPVKALHIGGPLGGLVPKEKFDELTIDFESFQEQGFLLGHASIIGIPESQNMAEYIHHLFEFTAMESCGKCFPCRLGATRGKEMFRDAIWQQQALNRELLDDLLDTMEKGSLCALGGGVPLPVKNALVYFEHELLPYFSSSDPNKQSNRYKSSAIDVIEVSS